MSRTKQQVMVLAMLVLACAPFALHPIPANADEAALPGLVEQLKNPDPIVRMKAAKELGRMGPTARSTIPALKALANDPDEDVRMVAANAIRKIEAGPDPRVAALVGKLSDDDPFVRMQAAKTLGQLGAAARSALPALRALSADPDEDVRMIAASAVRKIGPGAAPAAPPRPAAPVPAAPEKALPSDVVLSAVTSIFCQGYKDVTGIIKTPSFRSFLVEMKNVSPKPLVVTTLEVALTQDREAAGSEVAPGPESVILPGRTIYHTFDLPLRKASIGYEVSIKEVAAVDLDARARARAERNASLLERMRVLKARQITKFGVPVGERFTVQNPDRKPAAGIRVVLLGLDSNGKLTTMQFYYSEEVPSGFSEFVNNPTNEAEPRKGGFVFDGVADANRKVFPDTLKGLVIGVGVRRHEE